MAFVVSVQLELESLDRLFARRIVAYYSYFGFFTQVVLVLLEEDIRDALRSSHAEEAADLTLERVLEVSLWELHAWSLNVDHSCSSE